MQRKRSGLVAAVLLVLLALSVSCGRGSRSSEERGDVSVAGGTVTLHGIRFATSTGDISQDGTLVVSPVPEDEAASLVPQDVELLTPLYDIRLESATISGEVGLSIPLEGVDLDSELEALYVASHHKGQWRALPSVVDAEAGVVHAITTHFSFVGVFRDTIGQRPRIVDIKPSPDPYVYKTGSNHALTRDIELAVLVDDPASRVSGVEVRARFYTFRGDLVVGAVKSIDPFWHWFLEGNPDLGLVGALGQKAINEAGLTAYADVLPVSGEYVSTAGVDRIRFDVRLDTDGIDVEDSFTLNIFGEGSIYFELVSPAEGEVVGREPSFHWENVDPLLHDEPVELLICDNRELRDRGLWGGCRVIHVDRNSRELAGDDAPRLRPGEYWWGIVVRDSLGYETVKFKTAANQFTVTKGPWAILTVDGTTVTRSEIENDTGKILAWYIYNPQGEKILEFLARDRSGTDRYAYDFLVADASFDPGEYTVVLMTSDGKQYVPISKAVTVVVPTPAPGFTARVRANVLNVRAGPSTSYDIIGKLNRGEEVEILSRTEKSDWLRVRLASGQEGWVSAEWVEADGNVRDLPLFSSTTPTPTLTPTTVLPTATPAPATATPTPTPVSTTRPDSSDGSDLGQWEIKLSAEACSASTSGSGFGVCKVSVLAAGSSVPNCGIQDAAIENSSSCSEQRPAEIASGDRVEVFGQVTGTTAHGCGIYINICASPRYYVRK